MLDQGAVVRAPPMLGWFTRTNQRPPGGCAVTVGHGLRDLVVMDRGGDFFRVITPTRTRTGGAARGGSVPSINIAG
jgi:hypothetical protein